MTWISQLTHGSLNTMLSHILSNVRLDAIDGNHVFTVGQIEGCRLKIGLGYKLFQIYLLRLYMPQVGGPLAHFTVHKRHSGGISIGFLHTAQIRLRTYYKGIV